MARQVECTHAQLENITYQARAVCHARTTIAPSRSITHDDGARAQMCKMNKKDAMEKLGGPTALLKVQTTKVFELCAREAAQIFGGLSYVRGGQGEKVERLYREVRAYASAPPTASVAEAGEAPHPRSAPRSPRRLGGDHAGPGGAGGDEVRKAVQAVKRDTLRGGDRRSCLVKLAKRGSVAHLSAGPGSHVTHPGIGPGAHAGCRASPRQAPPPQRVRARARARWRRLTAYSRRLLQAPLQLSA